MENNANILIYTEGGFKLGLGNIYRSVALADALKKERKNNIKFITSSEGCVLDIIHKNKYPILCFKKNELLLEIINLNPEILIIDFLRLDENFTKKIKEKTKTKIIIIGNISEANNYADIVVNAIVGTEFKNKKYIRGGTLYLEGPKYLMLRDEFIKKRKEYVYREKLEKILLLFGGTDQANFTCRIFEDLMDYDKESKLTLVIGAGFKYEKELRKLMEKYSSSNINLHRNVSDVANFMLKSDFIITSAGTSLFEGFCLGVPTVGLFQNHSQEEVFRDFFMTKKYQDIDNIGKFMESVYKDYDNFNKKIVLINAGGGREEIISNILKL